MKKLFLSLLIFLVLVSSVFAALTFSIPNGTDKDKNVVGQIYKYGYVRERVKCVFYDTTDKQECYSEKGSCTAYSTKCEMGQKCDSMATCTVNVSGKKGERVIWKSTCGGYDYTTIDGRDEYAEFKCQSTEFPVVVKEQVKCVFANSNEIQKCYTDDGQFGCSGTGTCVADVSGEKGTKQTWKSSCGGYAYTIIDGDNDYAKFRCREDEIIIGYYVDPYPISWKIAQLTNRD